MKRLRILLADDHRLLREAFAQLLEPDCDVVAAVADGRALLAAARELHPDIVVLDIAMPLLNGLDAARQLKGLMPEVKLIFLTVSEDPDLVAEAFRVGASGYLLKNSAASELFKAIEEVSQGRSYVTPLATQGPVGSSVHSTRAGARGRAVEHAAARGHATAGGGAHDEGDRPHPGDHAPDRRLPQVPHDGGSRDQDQRRTRPVCHQASYRRRLARGRPVGYRPHFLSFLPVSSARPTGVASPSPRRPRRDTPGARPLRHGVMGRPSHPEPIGGPP